MNRRGANLAQPFQGCECRTPHPRVASQARQPWALRRNPFGILGLRRFMGLKSENFFRRNLSQRRVCLKKQRFIGLMLLYVGVWILSTNERQSGRGQPHSKTLSRRIARCSFREVLECGCPLPLSLWASTGTVSFIGPSVLELPASRRILRGL